MLGNRSHIIIIINEELFYGKSRATLWLQFLIKSTTVSMNYKLYKYKQYEWLIKYSSFLVIAFNKSIFLRGT